MIIKAYNRHRLCLNELYYETLSRIAKLCLAIDLLQELLRLYLNSFAYKV